MYTKPNCKILLSKPYHICRVDTSFQKWNKHNDCKQKYKTAHISTSTQNALYNQKRMEEQHLNFCITILKLISCWNGITILIFLLHQEQHFPEIFNIQNLIVLFHIYSNSNLAILYKFNKT